MLKYEDAKEIMNKYYYGINTSSLTLCNFRSHTCLVIRYKDNKFGNLRRILFFDDIEEFESFIQSFKWYESNKNICNIVLSDYEDLFPNLYFCINGRIVLQKNISTYIVKDICTKKEVYSFLISYYSQCRKISDRIYDNYNILVDFYNECIDLLSKYINKKKLFVKKEKESKKKINDSKIKNIINRSEKGIDNSLILELINICYGLELNNEYYEFYLKYKELIRELSLMLAYLDYIENLDGAKINTKVLKEIENKYNIDEQWMNSYVEDKLTLVKSKYNYANKLGLKRLVAFLEEAFVNNDYEGIADRINNQKVKIGKNSLFIDLEKQYNNCSKEEKQLATLYNSKYRGLFNYILDGSVVHDYDIKKLYKYIDGIEEVSRLKEECYDLIKDRIDLGVNEDIKSNYFFNISFTTYKDFLESLVKILISLNTISKKMVLNESIVLFYKFDTNENLNTKLICYLVDSSDSLVETLKEGNGVLGLFYLKEGIPVIYSPNTIDFGALYDENSNEIEVINGNSFNLAINIKELDIIDDNRYNCVNYYDIIYNNSNGINMIKSILLTSSVKYINYYVTNKKEG